LALFCLKNRIATQHVFNGEIFDVRLDTVGHESGSQVTREVVEHPGGVCIACKPTPEEVFLVKQYRYSVNMELIELPAGRVDPGENRLEAAKRELIEEIGYRADTWKELPGLYTAPGFCDELLSCYMAQDITWVGIDPDEDEDITVMRVKISDAWQMVRDGKIHDCKTIAILGLLAHM
jgi:ADP-ribose pyrophosphatase